VMISDSELGKAYEAHHAGLAQFTSEAIKIFAQRELSSASPC